MPLDLYRPDDLDDERTVGPASGPPRPRWQFGLMALLGLTALCGVAATLYEGWGLWPTVLFMVLFCVAARLWSPLQTADNIGALAGALAGFVLVALHGTALQYRIYHIESLLPYDVSAGALVFGTAGWLVGLRVPDGAHPLRYALNWGAAGGGLGGAIGILAALIAQNAPGGPISAVFFAVFVASYMGNLLATMQIADEN